jgi:PadR family transcriptional regulator PadR
MKHPPPKDLVGASTALLVLGVLSTGPNYGYAIVQHLNGAADGLFAWQEGTVYPVLHKLERDGHLRSQWEQADTGRQRKVYYITAKGRSMLRADAAHWWAFHALISRVLPPPLLVPKP